MQRTLAQVSQGKMTVKKALSRGRLLEGSARESATHQKLVDVGWPFGERTLRQHSSHVRACSSVNSSLREALRTEARVGLDALTDRVDLCCFRGDTLIPCSTLLKKLKLLSYKALRSRKNTPTESNIDAESAFLERLHYSLGINNTIIVIYHSSLSQFVPP